MTATPRRRIIRPEPPPTPLRQSRDGQAQKLRSRLEKERVSLARWMSRLKRAFNTVMKTQRTITRLEKLLSRTEDQPCQ